MSKILFYGKPWLLMSFTLAGCAHNPEKLSVSDNRQPASFCDEDRCFISVGESMPLGPNRIVTCVSGHEDQQSKFSILAECIETATGNFSTRYTLTVTATNLDNGQVGDRVALNAHTSGCSSYASSINSRARRISRGGGQFALCSYGSPDSNINTRYYLDKVTFTREGKFVKNSSTFVNSDCSDAADILNREHR